MTTGTAIFAFIAGAVLLGYGGHHMGRRWAHAVQLGGATLRARPHQYGWYLVAWAVLSGAAVAFGGVLLRLFDIIAFTEASIVATGLAVGAAGLAFGRWRLRPSLRARRTLDAIIRRALLAAALVSILTTFGIVLSIVFESIRFFQLVSFVEFITGLEWAPDFGTDPEFGSVPLFAGTFMIAAIAMIVALPIGLLAAIYMAEYAPPRVREAAKPTLEVLAGIPTVVYGFFAALTVAPLVVEIAAVFGLEASYNSALAAGLVMGIMIIPFISSLSDDVINSVPNTLREGAYALGTTRSETIRQVVLPAALPGIISAFLLAVSRALGETMIVVMAAGLRPNLTWNPLEAMTTVTVRIVDALTGDQTFDSAETLAAFALGLVLFVVTLALNLISVILVRRFRQRYAG